jgi:hypothetical protein
MEGDGHKRSKSSVLSALADVAQAARRRSSVREDYKQEALLDIAVILMSALVS